MTDRDRYVHQERLRRRHSERIRVLSASTERLKEALDRLEPTTATKLGVVRADGASIHWGVDPGIQLPRQK